MKTKPQRQNRTGRPSQIPLVAAIAKELDRQGYPNVNPRLFNAIVRAADLICAEYSTPHTPAAPASGLAAWLASDETGESSLALAWALREPATSETVAHGRWPAFDRDAYPRDPGDFGRCVTMLEAVPVLRERLGQAAGISPVWSRLIAAWDDLESLYREERPSGEAPKLYARLKEIAAGEA